MCFDADSRPPIPAGPGAVGESGHLSIDGPDGTRFSAYRARPAGDATASIVLLPDVRGLVPYYVELACRFAEYGLDTLVLDPFGRTAPPADQRPEDFEFRAHMDATTYDGLRSDVRGAVAHLRANDGHAKLFTLGFCFGGRLSFLAATFGLRLTGAVGFYPGVRPSGDVPRPIEVASEVASPLLGLFGGADPGIPPEAVAELDAALETAGVAHRFVTYPGAPHSFFDRKWEEFADESRAAWDEVVAFVRARARTGA